MDEKLIDKQWVDIIPPTAPADITLLIWIVGLALLAVLIMLAYLCWRRQSKQQALRSLRALQRNIRRQADTRQALFHLAEQLRRGFRVPRLDAVLMAGDRKQQWMQFQNSLHYACYRKDTPDYEAAKAFCDAGIDWLKQSSIKSAGSDDANA